MKVAIRAHVALTIVASISLASCYAHYSWLTVDAGDPRSSSVFVEGEKRAAISAAASVAEKLGLRSSWMQGLAPSRATAGNPFQELALFQGSGRSSNLMLTVAVKDDGTVLRFWISDLDHSQPTELVSELVRALKEELQRTFPNRRITVGGGRKLRIYAG